MVYNISPESRVLSCREVRQHGLEFLAPQANKARMLTAAASFFLLGLEGLEIEILYRENGLQRTFTSSV